MLIFILGFKLKIFFSENFKIQIDWCHIYDFYYVPKIKLLQNLDAKIYLER